MGLSYCSSPDRHSPSPNQSCPWMLSAYFMSHYRVPTPKASTSLFSGLFLATLSLKLSPRLTPLSSPVSHFSLGLALTVLDSATRRALCPHSLKRSRRLPALASPAAEPNGTSFLTVTVSHPTSAPSRDCRRRGRSSRSRGRSSSLSVSSPLALRRTPSLRSLSPAAGPGGLVFVCLLASSLAVIVLRATDLLDSLFGLMPSMSSNRTSLLIFSSLLKFRNGSCMGDSVDFIKTLNLLRTISTAAERSDFQVSGSNQTDDSLGYRMQNNAGFYRETQSNPGSHQNQLVSRHSPDYSAQANANGSAGGTSAGNRQNINPNWGHTEGIRNEYGNNLAARGGNFSGSYGNNHGSSGRISYGAGQVANESHISISRNSVQNNSFGHNGDVNGYYGQSNTRMQEKQVGVGGDNSKGIGMHQNAFTGNQNWTQEPRGRMQYPNAHSSLRLSESPGNLLGNLPTNIRNPSPNDHYSGSNEFSQRYLGTEQFQQTPKNGQYSPNWNTVQGSTFGSAKPDGVSAEASNDSPYRGTLEELDGFCMNGKVKEAVEVLELLAKLHIPVDLPRYLQLMHHCGEAKSLEEAKIVHRNALQYLSPLQVSTYNKILEMYFECGSVDDALNVFNNMPERNLTTWDTMITQLAKNGFAEDSIDLFTQFKEKGLKPDGQMFIGVFLTCSMLGDIDEGMLHFESMSKDFGIVPSMAHFVSVVDMIGSIGHLDEAFEFIEKMPMEPSVDVWETMMNLCRAHGNTELGYRCAELVEQLDPSRLIEQSKAGLVPVKASDLTKEKDRKLASKNPLEVRSRVHEYRAGDTSHPENDKIYALLRGMKSQMKEAGYIPETKFVLHDIDQEGKEEALLAHSERLAVAYGLLSSSARSPIRVIKNLRVCGDCHTALKIISKIVGRELIIRDAKRFHHFKDGLCSCRDYW
ncbi:pentatricopeptide repeat-containing protein At4g32450, mitochondrial [Arachis duranensis]|uniref:Pentatricopeptide repeat-containing protein At4g32450, mitochondrial n=1 Tax=Arachis duranensis TaxID=130453 RepID=A0A6P5NSX0_ARADU|nr:pentatricopeptide repeat-containing protein At4g32450, mitochondrial [Arachis duranensis]